jgi:hypothetical protein
MATATHTQNEILWSLSPANRHIRERIYSGREETVMVSVTILNPMPRRGHRAAAANGVVVPDGVLQKLDAVTSRIWFLRGVRTLDLVTRNRIYCSGSYAISVLISD